MTLLVARDRSRTPTRVRKAVDPLSVIPAGVQTRAREAVRALLDAVVEQVPLQLIETAITHRSVIDSLTFDLDPSDLSAILLDAVQAAGIKEARSIKVGKARGDAAAGADAVETSTLVSSFSLVDPGAQRWAETRAAGLVVEITEGTREALRALISRAVTEGGHPSVIAREIRPLVGLHSRWSTAVLNYRYSLADQGVAADQVSALTARYYDRLLTTRSKTIARTEILGSANQGKMEAWHQAQDRGLLGQEATKIWVAATDAEAICAELDGTEVGLREDFTSELGDVNSPPLHPNCRCTMSIGRSA